MHYGSLYRAVSRSKLRYWCLDCSLLGCCQRDRWPRPKMDLEGTNCGSEEGHDSNGGERQKDALERCEDRPDLFRGGKRDVFALFKLYGGRSP